LFPAFEAIGHAHYAAPTPAGAQQQQRSLPPRSPPGQLHGCHVAVSQRCCRRGSSSSGSCPLCVSITHIKKLTNRAKTVEI